jgi:hypothetical protein
VTELKKELNALQRKFGGITTTLRSIEDLTADQRRFVLNELLTDGVTLPTSTPATEEAAEPIQESTGLPQKLRGAVHELTRNYAPNLIVDTAMLEMPEEQRAEVAGAFLPKKPLREKLDEQRQAKEAERAKLYTVVDAASGEELGKTKNVEPYLRVLGKDGEQVDYKHLRTVPEYDFREADDVEPRMLVLYRQVTAE